MPFKKLANSAYPGRIASGYSDYLWMARQEEDDWRRLKLFMSKRLRWCAQDAEEFLQAAATQVVFNETVAIFRSLEARGRRTRRRLGDQQRRVRLDRDGELDLRGGAAELEPAVGGSGRAGESSSSTSHCVGRRPMLFEPWVPSSSV